MRFLNGILTVHKLMFMEKKKKKLVAENNARQSGKVSKFVIRGRLRTTEK